uniref:R-spondin 4 n=1 Tax=Salarias fasciatus TaxID=181472 RepID=A0A672FG61_SALFA
MKWSVLLSSLRPSLVPAARRQPADDCRSCLDCSRDNGCVRCPERLFLFLQRDGMSHHGSCLHACPAGHYGKRGKDVNRCMKCRSPDCEQCFIQDFCTKCRPGSLLFKGKCLSSCPDGTFVHNSDCLDDCLLAPPTEWTEWSVCLRDGAPCGFRWGRQTRTRAASPSPPCPSQSQTRRCRMKRRCPTGERHSQDLPANAWTRSATCLGGRRVASTRRPHGVLNAQSVPQNRVSSGGLNDWTH